MRKSRPLKNRALQNNRMKRLSMFKRTRKKILQRRREFVRAELIQQWSLAS
jgi:hypothetical protein